MVTPCERSGATAAERTVSAADEVHRRHRPRPAPPRSARAAWRSAPAPCRDPRSPARCSGSSVPVAPATRRQPAALVVGQHDDRAVRLEEAAGVLGHLVHDAVELDRLREDVAQLLQREQLADAPVELARELLALGLGRRAAGGGRARSRPRSCRRWSPRRRPRATRSGRWPARPRTPSRVAANAWSGHLPLAAPDGEQQDQRRRRCRRPTVTSPGSPPSSDADQGARRGAPTRRGRTGKRTSVRGGAGQAQALAYGCWATRSVT